MSVKVDRHRSLGQFFKKLFHPHPHPHAHPRAVQVETVYEKRVLTYRRWPDRRGAGPYPTQTTLN